MGRFQTCLPPKHLSTSIWMPSVLHDLFWCLGRGTGHVEGTSTLEKGFNIQGRMMKCTLRSFYKPAVAVLGTVSLYPKYPEACSLGRQPLQNLRHSMLFSPSSHVVIPGKCALIRLDLLASGSDLHLKPHEVPGDSLWQNHPVGNVNRYHETCCAFQGMKAQLLL